MRGCAFVGFKAADGRTYGVGLVYVSFVQSHAYKDDTCYTLGVAHFVACNRGNYVNYEV